MTTNDSGLMRTLGVGGVGLIYTLDPLVADEIARGRLRVLLEGYLPSVPGLFLYFPSRAQISPAFRAFVDLARETMGASETSSRRQAKP